MEKITVGNYNGFLAIDPEMDKSGILCCRVTGQGRKGPYDNVQLVQVTKKKGVWERSTRALTPKELAPKRPLTGIWCPFPVHMLADVIRVMNEMHKDLTGESVEEAEKTVKEEFDEVGEMIKSMGWKERGR